MNVTLADFEIRYKNLRKTHPELPQCSVVGCKNPVDITELGQDSSCSYHRLLFDYWLYEVVSSESIEKSWRYLKNQRARRSAFTRWRNKAGKEALDRIVLELAQEGINWVC